MARTLIVTNDFPPKRGGIENYVYQLARRLPADQIVVFTSGAAGDSAFDASLPFPVIRARTRVLLPNPHIVRGAKALIERFGCDSVWFGAAASLGLMASHLRRHTSVQRLVGSSHGHECFWAKAQPTRAAIRQLGESLDHITYISRYTERSIGAVLTPLARSRMVRLSPGVDPEQFWPPRDPVEVLERHGLVGRRVVLSISRLVPHKGQDTLIRALPRVLAAVPDAALLVVGDGPNREALSKLADRLSVAGAVRFAGPVPNTEIAPYYSAGEVFALPTRDRTAGLQSEGLGMVCLEAAAAGLPVVVGDSGGAPETVREGETGFVVRSTDTTAVADRLIELLSEPERAKAMGQAGRQWMAEDWSWDQRVVTLRGLLEGQA
ncbi:MAG: glycosyltransferase family 4 protein [Bifidobacteriaceae bacterium]|jgi:phosphatidylinositol alpha-1,6-mannosyltransferase|nr:glycosyltransferase family 4 protein [Bifidobacteriaceae bacterium]